MPLYSFSAAQAVETRKDNPFSDWGSRSTENRVEPLARPAFDVPFQMERGEPIFTIGSCFARNIENHLIAQGFRVPVREVFKTEAFAGMSPDQINNYAAPALFNDFAWALDPSSPFKPEDHILEVAPGKFVDAHLAPTLRPADYDTCLARRRALIDATATVKDCRVVIMTLGLAEVWFDRESGSYLNNPPRPSMIKAAPDRFELHVMSYEEVYDYLSRAMDLLLQFGHPDLQVIVTVSPVPLAATHRQADVMVANTYSKSVLRTAAEALVAAYSFVTYYPSFESVTLSDRQRAWADDLRHVTDEIVALNVSRMMRAFVPGAGLDDAADLIAVGGEAVALELADKALLAPTEEATDFFAAVGAGRSAAFAMRHARFLFERLNDAGAALGVLEAVDPEPAEAVSFFNLKAAVLLRLGRPAEAAEGLSSVIAAAKTHEPWATLVSAYVAAADDKAATAATQAWFKALPTKGGPIFTRLGSIYAKTDPDRAIGYYRQAIERGGGEWVAAVELGELLVGLGRYQEAREALAAVESVNPTVLRRRDDCLGLIPA